MPCPYGGCVSAWHDPAPVSHRRVPGGPASAFVGPALPVCPSLCSPARCVPGAWACMPRGPGGGCGGGGVTLFTMAMSEGFSLHPILFLTPGEAPASPHSPRYRVAGSAPPGQVLLCWPCVLPARGFASRRFPWARLLAAQLLPCSFPVAAGPVQDAAPLRPWRRVPLVRQAPSRRGLLVHGCIQWHVRGVLPLPHSGLPLELSLPSRALLPRGRTAAVGPPRLVAVGACCAALAVPCLCQPCTTLPRPFLRTLAWSCIAASLRRLRLGMA